MFFDICSGTKMFRNKLLASVVSDVTKGLCLPVPKYVGRGNLLLVARRLKEQKGVWERNYYHQK